MPKYMIDRGAFRRWLRSKAEDEIVGHICRAGDCPLARFMTETTGLQFSFGARLYSWSRSTDSYFAPDWAVAFIRTVDHSADSLLDDDDGISANLALRALGPE